MQTWRFQNPRIWNYPRSIRNFWIYMQNAKIPGSPRYPSYVRRYPRRYLASHDDQHIGQKLHSIRTLLELSNYADRLLTSFPARFPYDPFSIEFTNRRERRKAGGDKVADCGRNSGCSPLWIRNYKLFGKHGILSWMANCYNKPYPTTLHWHTINLQAKIMKWLWIIVLVALALPAAVPRKIHRSKPTPRLYGDSVSVDLIRTSSSKVRQKIVDIHNYFRTQVEPTAANMLVMKWHSGLAKAAQRWADRCLGLVHDNATGLYLDGFGQSGQNIFISTGRTLWNFPIRMWYMEYKDFKYGPNTTNEIHEIGHYTQVVWATTHLVGCGVSHCTGGKGPLGKDFYMYVCNYAPSGNYRGRLGLPYVAGKPCSMCKDHCTRGKLCTNACYHVDLWSNCAELVRTLGSWVCETDTKEGRERRKFCGATCNCKDKIYYHHG